MDEEQEKLLQDGGDKVRQQAYYMIRAIDETNTQEALKYGSNMIGELKTSLLSPRTYYELYMQVFDNLSRLQTYFIQEYRRGVSMSTLYQRVQYLPSILPRLYLLITVGSAYIQTKEVAVQQILKDLIQMTKGVQHPVRGLFLRYYLNKMCKDKLPDSSSEDGDVTDSLDFLLQNLSEMNRLWVRMQHTGSVRDKNRREKERSDLRVTVGENIVRLSSLEGISIELYKTIVLPKVLEVVTSSKDVISQQYLMDCIIQAFSDQYHLHTLEPLLEASTQLEATVEVKNIFINLLNRLSDHSGESEMEIVREIDIFNLIKDYVDKVILQGNSGEIKKLLQLQVAFLRLSLKCYPENTQNVNSILESCVTLLEKHASDGKLDPESLRSIVKLLSFPLDTLSLAILSMNHYPRLMNFLQFSERKQVALKIVQAVVVSRKSLSGLNSTTQLLEFISPLLNDSADAIGEEQYEFQDQQLLVARLVHLISSTNPQKYLAILNKVQEAYASGGTRRTVFTYPSLVFAYIRFLSSAQNEQLQEKAMRTSLEIIESLTQDNPELAINLYLQCLLALNSVQVASYTNQLAYEIGAIVLKIYQNQLFHSDSKLNSIKQIASTLIHLKCCDQDSLESLVTTCTQYSARQLKKTDQCEGVVVCTHLFWNQHTQHERRVVQCLQKGLRIAQICSTGGKNAMLYVLALNKYLYYYVQDGSPIDLDSVNSLVELARETIEIWEKDPEVKGIVGDARKYFRNTMEMIKIKKSQGLLSGVN